MQSFVKLNTQEAFSRVTSNEWFWDLHPHRNRTKGWLKRRLPLGPALRVSGPGKGGRLPECSFLTIPRYR